MFGIGNKHMRETIANLLKDTTNTDRLTQTIDKRTELQQAELNALNSQRPSPFTGGR